MRTRPAVRHLAAMVLATLAAGAAAQDIERHSQTLAILVIVESGDPGLVNPQPPREGEVLKVVQGSKVRIRGAVATGLAGKLLKITVTPPQAPEPLDPRDAPAETGDAKSELVMTGSARPHPPTTVTVTASTGGTFETTYTTKASGGHEVLVRDATGQHAGEAEFDVESATETGKSLKEELEREAKALLDNANAMTKAVAPKIRELPASPARDQTMEQAKELAAAIEQVRREDAVAELGRRVEALRRLQRLGPRIAAATQPLVAELRSWTEQARQANEEAAQPLAALTHGNVVCDQLDVVVNGLKFVDFYLGLFTTPLKFFEGWAKENVPTKLASLLPADPQRKRIGMETLESAWKGVLGKYPQGADVQKLALNLSSFVASRVFDQYCQTFSGPVTASMTAVATSNEVPWWRYRIDIRGQLVLRYPKNARGDAIPLTGEFLGNATKFKSWDNAIPILFPKLAAGTVGTEIRRVEPAALGDIKLLGAPEKHAWIPNPIADSIEKGGPAVQNILTPAFFRVPVRGDLRGDTLRIELQQAAVDFENVSTKVNMMLLPVLSMRIHLETYTLPYKGARFILFRAMDDGPAEFQVQRNGKTMVIERKFHRERKNAGTIGTYDLVVKACNPGCP